MKLSDYLAAFLAEYGVTHIFGYPGGAVTHILDSLCKREDIGFVGTCHEQAAAFAAEGYARIKNDIGVAFATSGPGATNLITGIGSAFFDSVPCLYITGQVNTYEYKGDLSVRQLGFQETDIVSVVKPITKYAVRITEPDTIKYELQKAISVAKSKRPGPVLLDIPMDIQRAEIDPDRLSGYEEPEKEPADCSWLPAAAEFIENAVRPVILVGGGVRAAKASALLERFAKKTGIPVVSSLMGLDACAGIENSFGLIGAYGNRYGNFALANSDLILSLGSRLDSRQTGTDVESFARRARLIRVDIDENELKRRVKPDELSIRMDAGDFLRAISEAPEAVPRVKTDDWLKTVKGYREKYPSFSADDFKNPNYIVREISKMAGEDDIICLDVGQNQMWAAQSFELKRGQRLLTSGGMGAMGFSLPAAVGAHYAAPGRSVIAFSGDGGFQMNIQELELVKRNRIPIKMIVMNNRALGMIRHFQEMYFEGRYGGTVTGYTAPDFCKIAGAYGIFSKSVENPKELSEIGEIIGERAAAVIGVRLPQHTYVFPKLAVGRPIEDQEPLLDRAEFFENMI